MKREKNDMTSIEGGIKRITRGMRGDERRRPEKDQLERDR
jgi:hypothetical protein